MSIHKRSNGTYEVRWRDGSGKNRSKSGYRRKVDAQEFERQTLTDLRRGTYVPPSGAKMTLTAWCDEWLAAAHHLAPKTRETYEHSLSHILPELGGWQLGQLTGTDIDKYLAARLNAGTAPSSVHREFRTLRTALLAAVKARKIPRSPHQDATAPVLEDTEMIFLTLDQLDAFVRAFDDRYRSWVLTAGFGGLRWGELAGLQARSVDVSGHRVHVTRQITRNGEIRPPKWKSKRWVSLPPFVAEDLGDAIKGKAPTDLVWTMPLGGQLDHRAFLGDANGWIVRWGDDGREWFPTKDEAERHLEKIGVGEIHRRRKRGFLKPAVHAAGLPSALSPHDLRHTAVALAIKEGAHPKAIQARMGHKNITTTLDRYGHLYDEMDEAIAVALEQAWHNRTSHRRLRAV